MLALPGAYFYLIYRKQMGGLEFRINKVISAYLFALAVIFLLLLLIPSLPLAAFSSFEVIVAVVLLATAVSLLTIFFFEPFQRLVERRLLSIPLPEKGLVEEMSRAIATSITMPKLISELKERIFPSLLIREALLVERRGDGIETLMNYGLEPEDEAKWIADLEKQREETGFRHAVEVLENEGSKVTWLLGAKDPDDHYSQSEREVLAVLASQLAVALTNIEQAGKLRALHQANITREEAEKRHLARELHDGVLNQVAQLFMGREDPQNAESFQQDYQALTGDIRATIAELRPPMLNFGLWAALNQLLEDSQRRTPADCQIHMQVEKAEHRFEDAVEENVYRIIQQALENALRHAKAKSMHLEGQLSADAIELTFRDDGVGMAAPQGDLVELLSARHFGLAGMLERAELIGAQIDFETAPGQGTAIRLIWKKTG